MRAVKNKQERINKLIYLLKQNKSIQKDKLCEELSISKVTLMRYVSHLNNQGYKIKSSKNMYNLIKDSSVTEEPIFSKGTYVSLKVLMYIYNNSPCSRQKIVNFFCNKGYYNDVHKMSVRNLDIHLHKLMDLNYIEKQSNNNSVKYKISQKMLIIKELSFEECVTILEYLKLSRSLLPFKDIIDTIYLKLNAALTNYIDNFLKRVDDINIVNNFISINFQKDFRINEEQMIYNLISYCRVGVQLEVKLTNNVKMKINPINIVYNWENNTWYLTYRKRRAKKGFELLKVKKIKEVCILSTQQETNSEEFISIKQNAERQVARSFGMSLDKATRVEIMFLNHFNVVEKVENILHDTNGIIKKLNDGSLYFSGEIEGIVDFLAWLRRFGSSAIILSPAWMRKQHIQTAYKVLENYEVQYE